MRIDPAIGALRSDRHAQRRARAALRAASDGWATSEATARVIADLARFGDGAPLGGCPALFGLFCETKAAPRLVAALVQALCTALAREPLGHPALRHGYERGTSTLLLAHRGRAQLVLCSREPGRRSFRGVTFGDGQRFDAVLAGQATARIVHRSGPSGSFREQPLALAGGVRLALDRRQEALQVLEVERRLVSLRLDRAAFEAEPSREYDLASGALLRQCAGDARTSRQEVMLAVLGRMARADAAPVMAGIARERGDASLRWQALRECLALDTRPGFV
ncbi:MAG TPA: hypothetical protein VFS37_01860, partial [Conexibacter sp.]|nr:hypothetical protein [Conexibacter sp.]